MIYFLILDFMEIVGYCNYLIYPDGKVSSKRFPDRYLKPATNKCGYKYVSLCKDGKQKTFKIHRLVAIHYIPNPENKREVDHINRDRKDNRVQNLKWATSSENQQNTGIRKNNKIGHKNICYDKPNDRWRYGKTFRGVRIDKYFKTLEEAIQFKNEYESKLN
jgi:hypothetical protein